MKAFLFSGLDSTSSHIIILQCKNPYAQTVKGMWRIISHWLQWKFRHQISPKVLVFFCAPSVYLHTSTLKAAVETGKAAQRLGAHSVGGKHRHPSKCSISSNHRASVLSLAHLHVPLYGLVPKHLLWELYSCWLTWFAAADTQPGKGFWQVTGCWAFLLLIPRVAKRLSTMTWVE